MNPAGQRHAPAAGRLSLRARLLIGLIAITSAFLVIMGVVAAAVLGTSLGGQFNAQLRIAAAHTPQQLADAPGNYLATVYAPRTGAVTAVTQGYLSDELRASLGQLGFGQFARLALHAPFTLTLQDGTKVRAVARRVGALQVRNAGLTVPAGERVFFLVVARPLRDLNAPLRGVILGELITGGALIVLLAVGGRWLIGRGLAPLGRMATAADRITESGDLTARMPDAAAGTETGRLAGAINTMLDRIQHAFAARWHSEQKIRTFAADASHELRTPLTTIKGYAELYRQGALGPGELPNAMRRIEEEAGRMGLLVAELLELARLDRTSSLNLTECDLAAVVRDAAADATAVEPGRPIKLDTPDQVVVVADEPRIRQVLANLLANVREHTSPATPVAIRLARAGRGVVIEVADAGPGMSAQDAAQAFDRFHRGSRGLHGGGAHPAGSGGAGLGLPIVQAIAQAHRGQAMLESAPGRGTIVRIWLPHAS
jgi:two-component system, OmpR family, sensor kinase